MENNIEKLFSFASNDVVREKLLQSADRITRSFDQLFAGYSLKAEDVLNETVRVEGEYQGLVEIRGISYYSYCEHHFAPFFGNASICYEPGEIITGLGKLVRLVKDVHARRLQIQEIMTQDIANDIMRVLGAKGVLVVTQARHLCICSRGPSDDNSETIVRYALGTMTANCL